MVAVGAVVAIMLPNELDTKRKPSNERREDSLPWIVGACNLLRFPSSTLARAGLPGVRGGDFEGARDMATMKRKRATYTIIAVSLYPAEMAMLNRLTRILGRRLFGTGWRANRSRAVGYALRKATMARI